MKRGTAFVDTISQVIECEKGRVNLEELLGLGSFSLSNVSHMIEELSDEEVRILG